MLTPWKENYDQPRQHFKKQRHYFANKGPSNQGFFPGKNTGVGCLSFPGDLPNPGIELNVFSLLYWQVGSLPLEPPGASL